MLLASASPSWGSCCNMSVAIMRYTVVKGEAWYHRDG